jgi:hypothetical protein
VTILHILYTANLHGNIDLLPRLYTFIRQLKALPLDDENEVMLCAVEPVQTRWLLLDLGKACDPAAWHCVATAGRSMLIALDAMGYHAANVDGMLTDESRERLGGNLMSMALVDAERGWQYGDIEVGLDNKRELNRRGAEDAEIRGSVGSIFKAEANISSLHILLIPQTATGIEGRTLYLAAVQAGQVGQAVVSWAAEHPQLIAAAVHDLPTATPPDPTIAGTVDFILGEARFFQGRHSSA